jgi:hypothetical protein
VVDPLHQRFLLPHHGMMGMSGESSESQLRELFECTGGSERGGDFRNCAAMGS